MACAVFRRCGVGVGWGGVGWGGDVDVRVTLHTLGMLRCTWGAGCYASRYQSGWGGVGWGVGC